MLFFNILSEKYTSEKIETALSEWKDFSKNEPRLESIESRLMNNNSGSKETNIIIYRKYPIYKNMTFPSHYYLTVDNKIWHPGYGDDMNIFQTQTSNNVDSNNYSIIEIKEKCKYCVYWELYKNFQSDKHFNVMINNCQIIMGMFAETICIIIIVISVIIAALSGHFIFLLITLYFLLVLFIFSFATYRTETYKFSTCPHIIPIRKY